MSKVYLAALRAHVELGEYQECQTFDYTSIVTRCLPKHMQQNVESSKIAQKHRELVGRSKDECNHAYMEFVSQWSLYGATLFEVLVGTITFVIKITSVHSSLL